MRAVTYLALLGAPLALAAAVDSNSTSATQGISSPTSSAPLGGSTPFVNDCLGSACCNPYNPVCWLGHTPTSEECRIAYERYENDAVYNVFDAFVNEAGHCTAIFSCEGATDSAGFQREYSGDEIKAEFDKFYNPPTGEALCRNCGTRYFENKGSEGGYCFIRLNYCWSCKDKHIQTPRLDSSPAPSGLTNNSWINGLIADVAPTNATDVKSVLSSLEGSDGSTSDSLYTAAIAKLVLRELNGTTLKVNPKSKASTTLKAPQFSSTGSVMVETS